jgi:ergothioneine biosynthesis protein EgtB
MFSERLAAARKETDRLFNLVRPDSLYERPIPERHRIIFYLGHLEAFDWNLLQPRLPNTKRFDTGLDHLFAFGIDPVDGGLPSDQPQDWPMESHVQRYRTQIRESLDASLANANFADWAGDESPSVLLNVAIEHRLMHAETLAYMLHQMPLDRKCRGSQVSIPSSGPLEHDMVEIPGGEVTLGIRRDDPTAFGWDNEYEAHTVHVPSFMLDRYKVTNSQYLEFMLAGGYKDRSLWTADDWNWIVQQRIAHPVFWKKAGENWLYRGMFEEQPLPSDWPVYVSQAEASAYARWAGKRLPTEAEWQRAFLGTPENPGSEQGYFDFSRWDPFAVNAFRRGQSEFGVEGMLANGWEWTSSLFEPFAGFKSFPFYEGYSANFFDGKHFVMKGGSTRTDRSMLRRSFRNWFQPHYQYVYAGFRCAR